MKPRRPQAAVLSHAGGEKIQLCGSLWGVCRLQSISKVSKLTRKGSAHLLNSHVAVFEHGRQSIEIPASGSPGSFRFSSLPLPPGATGSSQERCDGHESQAMQKADYTRVWYTRGFERDEDTPPAGVVSPGRCMVRVSYVRGTLKVH